MQLRALTILAAIALASCSQSPPEDRQACSVVSALASEQAYSKAIGAPGGAASEAVAKAGRCLERGADNLAYLPEPAENIARTILWECQSDISMAKPYSRLQSVTIAAQVDKGTAGAGTANLMSEGDENKAYDVDIREHALAAVIEARHHHCRSAHDIG